MDTNLLTLRNEIDSLFDKFSSPLRIGSCTSCPCTCPGCLNGTGGCQCTCGTCTCASAIVPKSELPRASINIKETKNSFLLDCSLPGYDKSDIVLNFDKKNNSLCLEADKKDDKEYKQGAFTIREHSSGSIKRTIPLPKLILEDKITANMKQGILNITMQKRTPSSPRQLTQALRPGQILIK